MNQNTAGTLSLRSARSGTKFEINLSLSTDILKAPAHVFVSSESLNISFRSLHNYHLSIKKERL